MHTSTPSPAILLAGTDISADWIDAARLQRAYDHLTSLRGIAARSAVQLLGELLVLPVDMDVRQWVAPAGLDVRHNSSGWTVAERPRISKVGNKHIRQALYMPTQVAIRHEAAVGTFYRHLVEQGRRWWPSWR